MPGGLCLPSRMGQLLVEHRTVDLPLYRQNEKPIRHGKAVREGMNNAVLGHRCEMLRVHLYRLLARRGPERVTRIICGGADVGDVSGNVDEAGYLWVFANFGNDRSSPGMANEDDWSILQRDNSARGI